MEWCKSRRLRLGAKRTMVSIVRECATLQGYISRSEMATIRQRRHFAPVMFASINLQPALPCGRFDEAVWW